MSKRGKEQIIDDMWSLILKRRKRIKIISDFTKEDFTVALKRVAENYRAREENAKAGGLKNKNRDGFRKLYAATGEVSVLLREVLVYQGESVSMDYLKAWAKMEREYKPGTLGKGTLPLEARFLAERLEAMQTLLEAFKNYPKIRKRPIKREAYTSLIPGLGMLWRSYAHDAPSKSAMGPFVSFCNLFMKWFWSEKKGKPYMFEGKTIQRILAAHRDENWNKRRQE